MRRVASLASGTRRGRARPWGPMAGSSGGEAVEVEPLDELAPAAHADLLEDVRQVVLDGVLGDDQGLGDLAGGGAARDQVDHLPLARAELVAGGAQPGHLARAGGLDDDHRLPGAAGRRL